MAVTLAGRTYWLVGASEGLGRALAMQLAAVSVRLCLSARNRERLETLAAELPVSPTGPHLTAPCDIAGRKSVAAAFASLPPIDGVIINAGVYEPVSAAAWNAEAVEAMCDVNLTGTARVLGQAVPALTAQGGGHIVIIGSLAGYRGLPGAIGYASSKAAVMHLTECLRLDLPSPAFSVQTINPGFIETRLTAKNDFEMPHIMTAKAAAAKVRQAMESGRFRTDFPGRFAWRFKLARMLPDALFFRLAR